jgi:hypothetical protein
MGMENEQKSGKKITIQSTKEDWERLKAIVSKLEKTTHSIQWCLEKEHKTKEEYKKNNNNNNKG